MQISSIKTEAANFVKNKICVSLTLRQLTGKKNATETLVVNVKNFDLVK